MLLKKIEALKQSLLLCLSYTAVKKKNPQTTSGKIYLPENLWEGWIQEKGIFPKPNKLIYKKNVISCISSSLEV